MANFFYNGLLVFDLCKDNVGTDDLSFFLFEVRVKSYCFDYYNYEPAWLCNLPE